MTHELVALRNPYSKTWDIGDGKRQSWFVSGPRLHNNDGSESNFELTRVDNAQLDGWRVVANDVHYALGKPGDKATDGWFGYGGRKGEHWLKWRLLRLGYLHWPTRAWEDIGGTPTYNRGKLSREVSSITIGPSGAERTIKVASSATWQDIWPVAGKGIDIRWRLQGGKLKEEVVIPQDARAWIRTNKPPSTPAIESYLSFVLRLDVSDIPKWWQAGQDLDIVDDNNDDAGAIQLRNEANDVLAAMPISQAFSEEYIAGFDDDDDPIYEQDTIRLRKRIWRENGNYYLLVGARVDHLNALHEGDIVFDPTFTSPRDVQGAGKDTYISVSNTDKHYGTAAYFDNLGGFKGLIWFDCSSVPSGATVTSAVMSFWTVSTKSSNREMQVKELLAANDGWLVGSIADPGYGLTVWDHKLEESSNGAADEVDWAGSAGCSTADTDFNDAVLGTGYYTANDPAGTEIPITLVNADIEDWCGGAAANYGVLMLLSSGSSFPRLDSSDSGTEAERPLLVVEYTTGGIAVLRRRRM